jgi:hypothetical protein
MYTLRLNSGTLLFGTTKILQLLDTDTVNFLPVTAAWRVLMLRQGSSYSVMAGGGGEL